MIDQPDLTTYDVVHVAMRRGAARLAEALADIGPDPDRLEAVRWYTDGLVRELHRSHATENDLFFPALAARVPAFADYEAGLAADHLHLTDVTTALCASVRALADGRDWQVNRGRAIAYSAELSRFLDEHLGAKDEDIRPLFARHFGAEEYHRLEQQAIKRIGIRQLLFTVPWTISLADPHAAAHFLATAPKGIRIIWWATRRRHARLAATALGTKSPEVAR